MTSSFINETTDQELSFHEMNHVSGGWIRPALRFIANEGPDAAKFWYNFGKGVLDGKDWDNAAYDAGEESGYVGGSSNTASVAPGPDGKGCTDRNLPV